MDPDVMRPIGSIVEVELGASAAIRRVTGIWEAWEHSRRSDQLKCSLVQAGLRVDPGRHAYLPIALDSPF